MARLVYPIRPLQHAISVENPSLFVSQGFAPWVSNGRIDQNSFKKRPGYYVYRNPGRYVYAIVLYQTIAGSRYTLYLTDTDLISREASGTFSYKTASYTAGAITGITGTPNSTVEGNGTVDFVTGAVAASDKFIMATDLSDHAESNAHWATIGSVTDLNTLVLSGVYGGAQTTGSYVARKIYSVPANERWSWAIVDDKFCFTNGNTNVQYWAGTGYATDLNATYAVKSRYCIEYANRLFLADTYLSSIREPLTLVFSKEGDPTDFTDSTAGRLDLLDTEDYLMGLGKVGNYLVMYKENNVLVYGKTGDATNPIRIAADRRGIGCVAPYSIVEFMGTNAFIGRDDFYVMNGDQPEAIGGPIRSKFFSMVGVTEIKKTFSGHNANLNELYWTVNTINDGQITFAYNYKTREWTTLQHDADLSCWGRGNV